MGNRALTTNDLWEQTKYDLARLDDALRILAPLLSEAAMDYADETASERLECIALLARLAAEARRLREGEAPDFSYEGVLPTRAQWLAFFNAQENDRRMKIIDSVIVNGESAHQCLVQNHEEEIDSLRKEITHLREILDRRKDMTIQSIQIQMIEQYANRLMKDGPDSRGHKIGNEILRTIGKGDG